MTVRPHQHPDHIFDSVLAKVGLTELSCVARAVLYYSRSLKPVQAHKVAHIKDYLPKACPSAGSVILDAEILMVDKQGKMLPVRPSLWPRR